MRYVPLPAASGPASMRRTALPTRRTLLRPVVLMLCLGGCQTPERIVLRPHHEAPHYAVVRRATPASTTPAARPQTAPVSGCERAQPGAPPDQQELFEQFEATQRRSVAGTASARREGSQVCRPAG